MNRERQLELKDKIRAGNVLALTKYLDWLYSESLRQTLSVRDDHRYHQSRTNTIQEILNLLPEASA